MKKLALIVATLGLFALSLYVAFSQGAPSAAGGLHGSALEGPALSLLVYSGVQAQVALFVSTVMQVLMRVTAGQVFWAIVLLALLVELVLLYPSVRIQLKQKKIHLFHKKLVDRFRSGELSYGQTERELHKLYAVNEKIHARGALFVTFQLLLFLAVFWGLNLMVNAPELLQGSWNALNFNLLNKPVNPLVPVLVSLLYFLHSLIKIVSKEREDYISSTQTTVAILFALITSTLIYFFANTFALALSVYFATLITFATLRYLYVDQHAQAWGELAQKELIETLRHTEPYRDRFEYTSQKWNHFPVVRYINFHLLEEALSMSLGLLLALNFFGVFNQKELSANLSLNVPTAYAVFPTTTYRACDPNIANPPLCENLPIDTIPAYWGRFSDFIDYPGYLFGTIKTDNTGVLNQLPISCCSLYSEGGTDYHYQAIKSSNALDHQTYDNFLLALYTGTPGCVNVFPDSCNNLDGNAVMCSSWGCTWNAVTQDCSGTITTDIFYSICYYQVSAIPHVQMAGCLAPGTELVPTVDGPQTFTATGGAKIFKWKVTDDADNVFYQEGDGTVPQASFTYLFNQPGQYKVKAEDYWNPLNNTDTTEGASPATTCTVNVANAPIGLDPATQVPIIVGGPAVTFTYSGGPTDRSRVQWDLMAGPGSLDSATGVYTPSANAADAAATITVRATDLDFTTNDTMTLTYVSPTCNASFGLYDVDEQPFTLAGGTALKNVYSPAVSRFYVKNAFLPHQFEFGTIADPTGVLSDYRTGYDAEKDLDYIDLTINHDLSLVADIIDVPVRDKTVFPLDATCFTTARFQYQGQGIRILSPTKVNVGL